MNTYCCMNRRGFLKSMFAGAAALGGASILSPNMLLAATPTTPKNLIVVYLSGGYDGLFFFPYINSLYSTINGIRGSLAVTQGIQQLNSTIGMHSEFAPLAFVHASGNLKLIQNIGFVGNSNRSHEGASKQVQALDPAASGGSSGILGLLKERDPNMFGDYSVWGFNGGDFMLAPAGAHPALIVNQLSNYSYNNGPFSSSESAALRQAAIDLLNIAPDPSRDSAERQAIVANAKQSHAAIPRIAQIRTISLAGTYTAPNAGGNSLANSMQDSVRAIKDNYSRATGKHLISYVGYGGFDSHDHQLENLPGLMRNVAYALAGAVQDLSAIPDLYKNTTIMLVSEFGRAIAPNGGGTDHGGGNTAMVLGGSVNGGANVLAGILPTAANLTNPLNYLEPTLDWRHLFAEVFNWMGFDPNLVIPGGYQLPTNTALRPNLYLP